MKRDIYDIITDLLRGDISKDEAIDLLVELFKGNKIVKVEDGTYTFMSPGTVLFQGNRGWRLYNNMERAFAEHI